MLLCGSVLPTLWILPFRKEAFVVSKKAFNLEIRIEDFIPSFHHCVSMGGFLPHPGNPISLILTCFVIFYKTQSSLLASKWANQKNAVLQHFPPAHAARMHFCISPFSNPYHIGMILSNYIMRPLDSLLLIQFLVAPGLLQHVLPYCSVLRPKEQKYSTHFCSQNHADFEIGPVLSHFVI